MSFDVESVASQAAQQYEQAYHTHETLYALSLIHI